MLIKKEAMGEYQTNCYIVFFDDFEIIIDSGVNSLNWIENSVSNPKAILLTHGHFDHMWDIYKVSKKYNIPIFINKNDEILLKDDIFGRKIPKYESELVTLLENNSEIEINGLKIYFHHFAGHSEGSSIIEIENNYFCGDVIFKGSIGRFDFPFSNSSKMKQSLIRALDLNENFPVHCGHGDNTTIKNERDNLNIWIENWAINS